jgi:hypothetical protein
MGLGGVDFTHVCQNGAQWPAVVNTVIEVQ